VVESRVIEQLKQGYDGTGFGVERAVDDARNSALEDCPCAHRARFEGHEHRAIEQSPGVQMGGGLSNGDHFGMGRRIGELLALVEGACDDFVLVDDDGTDRHFVLLGSLLGQFKCLAHPVFIAKRFEFLVEKPGVVVEFHRIGLVHRGRCFQASRRAARTASESVFNAIELGIKPQRAELRTVGKCNR